MSSNASPLRVLQTCSQSKRNVTTTMRKFASMKIKRSAHIESRLATIVAVDVSVECSLVFNLVLLSRTSCLHGAHCSICHILPQITLQLNNWLLVFTAANISLQERLQKFFQERAKRSRRRRRRERDAAGVE